MNTQALDTRASVVVTRCQVCDYPDLESVLFLGYLPPVNVMPTIGTPPHEQPSYPARVLYCPRCQLVQLGLIVDPRILFPPDYPYTSGTTRILRDNFADLYRECRTVIDLTVDDVIVDIGSNDGTLLSHFAPHHRVVGIEPTNMGRVAVARGIPTYMAFFDRATAEAVRAEHGPATIVTAANVFAHMDHIHDMLDSIRALMDERGIFISESHYLMSLMETLQYDTVYHEHLRYYSLSSLQYLLRMHGLSVIHARRIPTHGGSIRVYAARQGAYAARDTVAVMLQDEERQGSQGQRLQAFQDRVVLSKLQLHALFRDLKQQGQRVAGISAPSRASTLINYTGLDEGLLSCVYEITGSHKIGKYIPGTLIPVVDEAQLYETQPESVLLLSWHIADELIPKLKQRGYHGDFIVPLPEPRIVRNREVAL